MGGGGKGGLEVSHGEENRKQHAKPQESVQCNTDEHGARDVHGGVLDFFGHLGKR